MFNDDPRDAIHTVPFALTPVEDDIKKAPLPQLSLWMSEYCSSSVVLKILTSMYVQNTQIYVSITGLPWGLVSSLPRSIQTLVAQSGVDRKSLSIVDTIMRGECFGPPVLL